jgi:uncharacterized protein RhaS with RHS repeats
MSISSELRLFFLPGDEEKVHLTVRDNGEEEVPLTLCFEGREQAENGAWNDTWHASADLSLDEAEALHRYLGFALSLRKR